MIYIDDHINDFDLQAALAEISEQRREQALSFRFEQGQRTCVLAYLLLKKGLQQEYDIWENPLFEYGEHGKPSLVGLPHIHFNLSHCRVAAICVVSDKPVGVDIETIRPYKESLARYAMNDDELQLINGSALEFTKLWTQKEAVVKLSGRGITTDLKSVLTSFAGELQTTVTDNYVYSITL